MKLKRTIENRAVDRLLAGIEMLLLLNRQQFSRRKVRKKKKLLQGKFESKPERVTCSSCYTTHIQREENPEKYEELLQGKMIDTL
jgi:hypothetical protein